MRNNELVFCECGVRYKLHIEKYEVKIQIGDYKL